MMQTALDKLIEGDVFAFVIDVFTGAMPLPIFALLVFAPIGAGYYITQRSVAIPLVMFIMIGGTTIVYAPTVMQEGLIAVIVVAVAGIGYVLLNRVRV